MQKKKRTLLDIKKTLDLNVLFGDDLLNREIECGYISDVLSNVMGKAKPGDIWVTYQGHPNIVAVAILKHLAAIIIIGGREPEKGTIKKAEEEKIPLLTSELPAFEIVGKLYDMGISGLH